MPSKVVTADTTAQEVTTLPKDKIGKITGIIIDNQSSSKITITLQDKLTGVATEDRFVITVEAGDSYTYTDRDGNIEFYDTLQAVASATDSACKITVVWKEE